eukprot:2969741-Amphidinium_carterae.1
MKLEPAKLRTLCMLQRSVEARTATTLSTWCASGCTASWTAVMADAHRRGWSVLERLDGKRCWVYTAAWQNIRLSVRKLCVGSERAACDAIAARLLQQMGTEPLMRQFESGAFSRAFCSASKKVQKACGSSACVALCRLFLGGVAVPSKHVHDGGCCACFDWHTGGLGAIVARGCYRRRLSGFRAMAWLSEEEPQALPLLVIRCASSEGAAWVRRLGALSRLLVELLHTCRFQRIGNELHQTAICNLAARRRRH